MEICPLKVKEEDGRKLKWLVIPFDRPVQVAACSIVGQLRHSGATRSVESRIQKLSERDSGFTLRAPE
jgi:hypothetical protein